LVTYEIGKMYGHNEYSELPNDVAAGLLAETALGPFFIGGSVGDSGHRKWFFSLAGFSEIAGTRGKEATKYGGKERLVP